MQFYTTKTVYTDMENNDDFRIFVSLSIERHLKHDWGDISRSDAKMNDTEPETALSSYHYKDGRELWIKTDDDYITCLYPNEW